MELNILCIFQNLVKNDLFEYQHQFFIASSLRRKHFICIKYGILGFDAKLRN